MELLITRYIKSPNRLKIKKNIQVGECYCKRKIRTFVALLPQVSRCTSLSTNVPRQELSGECLFYYGDRRVVKLNYLFWHCVTIKSLLVQF